MSDGIGEREERVPSHLRFTVIRAGFGAETLAREAIVKLHRRAATDKEAAADFLRDPARYLLLALERQHVIGSLTGFALRHPHRRDPQFLLYDIDVSAEHRNRGIGKALVEAFISEARAAGAYEVWLLTNESNEAAMTMYAGCGLTRPNRDDVMLSLPLEPGEVEPANPA